MVIVGSLAYIPIDYGSTLSNIPEIIIPLGISIGLIVFTTRLRQRGYEAEHIARIVRYGWGGALVSTLIGGWWIAIHLYHELPVVGLYDQVLTVLSLGIGAGVLIGMQNTCQQSFERQVGRTRLINETTWTNRATPEPILVAIVEQLAERKGVRPNDLSPISNHINPDVFSELTARDDSQWQLRFHTDEYEIRVSSQGTVSVYDD